MKISLSEDGGMPRPWTGVWLLSVTLISRGVETLHNATHSTTPTSSTSTSDELSKPRSLSIENRQDASMYQSQGGSSYYPYPLAPYPPPTYGPPPSEIPPGMVHIEFAFDEIVLRCIAEEPYEHIIWTRYRCPQQFLFGGEGVHIAEGSNVFESELYDVHIRGHDGTIISELLIKQPLADNSDGIYQCEVWPHIHHGGNGYLPLGPYQNYNNPPKSEVFIIGGNGLLQECYGVNALGIHTQTSKVSTSSSKEGIVKDFARVKPSFSPIKPRRNITESRKDSDSKQLRYNLKYLDNSLHNLNRLNVTTDFFLPSNGIHFGLDDIYYNTSKGYKSYQPPKSRFSSLLKFPGRSNDKFREILPSYSVRKSKFYSELLNTSTVQNKETFNNTDFSQ